jgi:hypothetical protein
MGPSIAPGTDSSELVPLSHDRESADATIGKLVRQTGFSQDSPLAKAITESCAAIRLSEPCAACW